MDLPITSILKDFTFVDHGTNTAFSQICVFILRCCLHILYVRAVLLLVRGEVRQLPCHSGVAPAIFGAAVLYKDAEVR